MALETGARLGPYEILSVLGTGGMGEVYKARDTRLDRTVAIKVIRKDHAEGEGTRMRFEHEARLVAQISHPCVLTLHDFGIHEGAPYMVSEFLDGESLRALIRRGPVPPKRATEIAREVAEGLAAAHDRGIVHRDLKPENILITKAGRAKVLDFGIAKAVRKPGADGHDAPTAPLQTEPGFLVGTAGYVSPEQARGGEADSRSDIFAFGAIVHEMLSGRKLFVRGSNVESLNAILKDDPPELSADGAVVPPNLESTVRRCLEKDPALRFQSAHDLAFALDLVDTTSRRMNPAALTGARSSRGVMKWFGLAAVAMMAFAVGWSWPGRNAANPGFEFHRLTFQPAASMSGARFAPDGQTVVYDGRFGSSPAGVFTTRTGSHEFRSLDLPPGTQVLSVSSNGDLAIRLTDRGGILAQVPLAGGVPRHLVENVASADWSPDGKELAIVRNVPGATRLEYPVGTALAEVKRPALIASPHVSPEGDRVAFLEIAPGQNTPGRVAVVDRKGSKRFLTQTWLGAAGAIWSDDGRELYFSGTNPEMSTSDQTKSEMLLGPPALRAVDMEGHERLVLKSLTELVVRDARHGRLLVTQTVSINLALWFYSATEKTPRDLAWLNWSMPADISADGKLVLFDESRTGDGTDLVYLRKTDGTPPVRLGKGMALALSADGAWAATVETRAGPSPVVLLPTGAGERRVLKASGLTVLEACFFPDGKRLLLRAAEAGRGSRLYVLDIATDTIRSISPEGVFALALSPDGERVATRGPGLKVMSFPTAGGEGVDLKGFEVADQPLQWAADGRSLFVLQVTDRRFDVFKVNLESGKREPWASHSPDTPQGRLLKMLITPDGKTRVVTASPSFVELYVVDGVR